MMKLDVYVADGCWSCEESLQIAADVRAHYPHIRVAVIDAAGDNIPQEIFATPTWMLDGRVISLGNPSRQELYKRFDQMRVPRKADKQI